MIKDGMIEGVKASYSVKCCHYAHGYIIWTSTGKIVDVLKDSFYREDVNEQDETGEVNEQDETEIEEKL